MSTGKQPGHDPAPQAPSQEQEKSLPAHDCLLHEHSHGGDGFEPGAWHEHMHDSHGIRHSHAHRHVSPGPDPRHREEPGVPSGAAASLAGPA